jgi:hypothetical protein
MALGERRALGNAEKALTEYLRKQEAEIVSKQLANLIERVILL